MDIPSTCQADSSSAARFSLELRSRCDSREPQKKQEGLGHPAGIIEFLREVALYMPATMTGPTRIFVSVCDLGSISVDSALSSARPWFSGRNARPGQPSLVRKRQLPSTTSG